MLGLYWDNGKENGNYYLGLRVQPFFVSINLIEYVVYGGLTIIYPKPYSIYLRGTIGLLGRV